MRAISQGDVFTIYSDSLKTYEQLPAQVYNVRFSKQRGFFLEVSTALEIKESKIYGVHDAKCQKVLKSFEAFNRNLGVILSGERLEKDRSDEYDSLSRSCSSDFPAVRGIRTASVTV